MTTIKGLFNRTPLEKIESIEDKKRELRELLDSNSITMGESERELYLFLQAQEEILNDEKDEQKYINTSGLK